MRSKSPTQNKIIECFAQLGKLNVDSLFGAFLVWAICDRISLKRRPAQAIRTAPQGRFNDLIAVVAGLALYVIFILWAHVRLFGVSPLS